MAKTKLVGHPWNFCVEWNQAINSVPEKPLVARNYCWASELGGSYVDRYLRMYAIPYTNPPNERSRRKFSVGEIFEWVVGMVMTSIGLLRQKQVRAEVDITGLLRVTGKMDFIAGGEIDWDKAEYEIKRIREVFALSNDDIPRIVTHAIDYVFDKMKKRYKGKILMLAVYECKSISSRMFESVVKKGAMPHHVLQGGHYIIGNQIGLAKIGYISKDDCLMEEFDVENSPALLKAYKLDIAQMTAYYNEGQRGRPLKHLPPIQKEVLFDEAVYRFEKNYKVEYSPYLKMLYNYDTPEAYRDKWTKQVGAWNRGFRNVVLGKKVQQKTLDNMTELKKLFPDLDRYVLQARKEGIFEKPETEEDADN